MTAAAGTVGTSWMSTAARLPESDNRKVCNRRDAGNIQQGRQQQDLELTTRTLATAKHHRRL